MIVLKFIPTKEPVVRGETLYDTYVSKDRSSYEALGLRVRAKNAAHAEEKVLFCFRRELAGKTLSFDPSQFAEATASTTGKEAST